MVTFVMSAVVFVCWFRFFLHLEPRESLFSQYCQKQHILLYLLCLACVQSRSGLSTSKWMTMKVLEVELVQRGYHFDFKSHCVDDTS